MALRCHADEVDGIAVVGTVQHVERLAEAKIAQNVHGEPAAPVGHVLGRAPSFLFCDGPAIIADGITEGSDVVEDVAFHALDGAIREGVRQHTPFPGVQILVAGVVCVGRGVDKGVVELGLADIGLEAINVPQGRVGVDRE